MSERTASSSNGVIVIGKDLTEPVLKDDLSLSSDQDSTNGEDAAAGGKFLYCSLFNSVLNLFLLR